MSFTGHQPYIHEVQRHLSLACPSRDKFASHCPPPGGSTRQKTVWGSLVERYRLLRRIEYAGKTTWQYSTPRGRPASHVLQHTTTTAWQGEAWAASGTRVGECVKRVDGSACSLKTNTPRVNAMRRWMGRQEANREASRRDNSYLQTARVTVPDEQASSPPSRSWSGSQWVPADGR